MRRIVYFVGAGLSKALEKPSYPIPLMYDYIRVMSNYLDDDVILTQLSALETEEPYPYKWHDPEGQRIGRSLNGEDADRNAVNRSAFQRALRNKPIESIEDILEKTGAIAAVRFRYAINRLFSIVDWNVNWQPLERFFDKQIELQETEHIFISFNYDLILDHAIQSKFSHCWDVYSGYGFKIPLYLDIDPQPDQPDAGTLSTIDAQYLRTPTISNWRIKLLKPHGSLNWLVPLKLPYEDAGLIHSDGPVIITLSNTGALRYFLSTEIFNYVNLPDALDPSDVAPCIVPPTSRKSSNLSFLKDIRAQEMEAIKTAAEIYIIGWSLPETDRDQEAFVRVSISGRSKPIEQLTVITFGSSPSYFERIADIFKVKASDIRIFNSGFCDFAAKL